MSNSRALVEVKGKNGKTTFSHLGTVPHRNPGEGIHQGLGAVGTPDLERQE